MPEQVRKIITTEKDAIKITQPPDFHCWLQSINQDADAIELALKKCLKEKA
jgi:hypothetical protein